MKFSQKVFIMSYILIISSMYLMGGLLIYNNYKISIDKEIERAIFSHNAIRNMIYDYSANPTTDGDLATGTVSSISPSFENTKVQEIAYSFLDNNNENKYIQIYENNNIIYTNILGDLSVLEKMGQIQVNSVTTCITDIEEKEILLVSSIIENEDNNYELLTGSDISYIYKVRKEQIEFFIKVGIILTFAISIVLFLFVYILTRRIKILSRAIRKVSRGNYSVKVDNMGKDEIGELSQGFNNMVKSVNENIEEIKRISENRQIFINDLTHEIRTPLTSIIGFSNLLKNVNINDKQVIIDYSSKIYEEGKYIKEISDKLMEIILLDNQEIQLQEVNISDAVKQACEMIKETINKTGNYVIEQIDSNVIKKADPELIKSLVTNLIKNSSKAYEYGGKIEVVLNNKYLVVKDYGKGIKETELEKILEPFYTLNKSRNRKETGMGLGLPLCIKICNIHGFKFEIKSRQNIGTEVIIYF